MGGVPKLRTVASVAALHSAAKGRCAVSDLDLPNSTAHVAESAHDGTNGSGQLASRL
jgi:hypothetical protein